MFLAFIYENGVTCLGYTPIANSIKFLTPNHFSLLTTQISLSPQIFQTSRRLVIAPFLR